MPLEKPISIIIKKCFGYKKNESILIITDSNMLYLANKFLKVIKKITNKAKLIETPIAQRSGQEPPKNIAEAMKQNNILILLTTKSLSHTKARINAAKKGARIASMPSVREETIERAIDINYKRLAKETNKLKKILDNGKIVKVMTKKGTDITFTIKGRKGHGFKPDILTKKSSWANLPDGEAFIAPIEGTANGIYIVDKSQAGIGKLIKPLKFYVKDGFVEKIEGKEAKKLLRIIKSAKNKKAFNIAEFGIGTNPKARLCGSVLEDEKVKGTCHIAIGNNFGFGGKVNVPLHLDGVFSKPTVFVDNKKIIDNGKFIF